MNAAKQLMWEKMDAMSTELLVDVCRKLKDNLTEEAGTVLTMAMTLLDERLPSAAFVSLCDEL
jgi:hypothetical protein